MKAFFKRLKRHWITVWLVTVSVIFSTFVAYAIYTEVSSIKRVVTTKSAPKVMFSSNCMFADLYERRMASSEFNVNVNNFDINSPDVPNPADIQYTLTAQLRVKYQGTIMTFTELATELAGNPTAYNTIVARATGYKIGKSQDNNSSGTITFPLTEFSPANGFEVVFNGPSGSPEVNYETLPGSVISTDRFKVQIPQSDFEKTYDKVEFFVYVQADPVDAGLNNIQTLLYGCKNVVVSASWTGTLVEQNTAEIDYDFYNYVISGSGSGKLDIMWDPNWFEVDDFFFGSLSGVTFDGGNTPTPISSGTYTGWYKVTIVVDSSEKSRYELQLYKKKSDTSYTGATNNANKFIRCEMQ